MIRTEDKADVQKYLSLLDSQGMDIQKSAAVHAFRELDSVRRCLGMVLEEPECIRGRIGILKDGAGKRHAALAIAAAQEMMDEVKAGAARVDALVGKGVKDSVAGFQRGAAGAGEQAWLDVLWPMRSLEKMIASAQDTVHDAAYSVDSMRPKAHSVIKKHVLVPGLLWEQAKERERADASGYGLRRTEDAWSGERMDAGRLCVAEDVMLPKDGPGQAKGRGKPSLRKRLKAAGEKSGRMQESRSLQGQKSRAVERQM